MKVKHGRLELSQLDGSDSNGPDVTQVVVAALLFHRSHLGSHPGQRIQNEKETYEEGDTGYDSPEKETLAVYITSRIPTMHKLDAVHSTIL